MGLATDLLPDKRKELIYCCKTGDLDKIKYLLDVHEIEVHFRDEWDTTPLYYACLCGHHNVVKFLLQNGARCEANTFDGERCFYAALTDSIKKTLSDYKMITSRTMRRGLYDEFLRRLLESASFSDCSFRFHELKYHVHKCMIAVRCPELHEKLRHLLDEGKNIKIKDLNMHPQTLQCLLNYVYTGHMQAPTESSDCIISLSKQFGLNQLASRVHETVKELQSFTFYLFIYLPYHLNIEKIRKTESTSNKDLEKLVIEIVIQVEEKEKRDKPGVSVDRISIENPSDVEVLKSDINKLVLQAVPKYLHHLLDHILLTEENVCEVLYTADMFLLPGLTKLSASYLGTRLDTDNIFSAIETSRLFKLDKLENQCMSFIAENLQQLIEGPELAELILADARSVKHRQETDTVDVVDSIRYHINNQQPWLYNSQNWHQIGEDASAALLVERKLQLLDDLLLKLDLEC